MKFLSRCPRLLLVIGCFMTIPATLHAQDPYQAQRATWLAEAEALKPTLTTRTKLPVRLVTMVRDPAAFQGWKAVPAGPVDSLYRGSFKKKSGMVVDFGEHLTGTYSFSVQALHSTPDAPLRFKFTFGEVPAEVMTPFDSYSGNLSRAWLQDEVVTVMELPATITIARRLAFRYVKIELLGASQYFGFHLTGMSVQATTSAQAMPPALAAGTSPMITRIDRIGLVTLRECRPYTRTAPSATDASGSATCFSNRRPMPTPSRTTP